MIIPNHGFETKAVEQYFDELDEIYRAAWCDHVHHGLFLRGNESVEEACETLVALVADSLNVAAGHQICDVGCGYGASGRWLAENCAALVTGITNSPKQVEFAEALNRETSSTSIVTIGDWAENGFPSDHFDGCFAIESIEFMSKKQLVISEMARVVRPGGRVVICSWLAAESPTDYAKKWLLEPICRESRQAGLGSASEHRKWIQHAGLELVRFGDLSNQVAKTWTVTARQIAFRSLRDRRYISFLLDSSKQNRGFAKTVIRLRLAYALGVLKYGFFVADKPK